MSEVFLRTINIGGDLIKAILVKFSESILVKKKTLFFPYFILVVTSKCVKIKVHEKQNNAYTDKTGNKAEKNKIK